MLVRGVPMLIEDHHITLTSLKEFIVLVDKYDMEHLVQILQSNAKIPSQHSARNAWNEKTEPCTTCSRNSLLAVD
jgi:hypothetical protein